MLGRTFQKTFENVQGIVLIVSPGSGKQLSLSMTIDNDGVDKNGNSDNIERDNDEMDSEHYYNIDNYDENDGDSPVQLSVRGTAVPSAILGLEPFGQTTNSESANFWIQQILNTVVSTFGHNTSSEIINF